MPTGYVVGAFDMLNVRDIDVISQVRERCARIVVGVLDDDEVQRLYGRPPVVPLTERLQLVEHVRGVDTVVVHRTPFTVRDGTFATFLIENEPVPDGVGWPTTVTPRRLSRCNAVRRTVAPVAPVAQWAVA